MNVPRASIIVRTDVSTSCHHKNFHAPVQTVTNFVVMKDLVRISTNVKSKLLQPVCLKSLARNSTPAPPREWNAKTLSAFTPVTAHTVSDVILSQISVKVSHLRGSVYRFKISTSAMKRTFVLMANAEIMMVVSVVNVIPDSSQVKTELSVSVRRIILRRRLKIF